MEADVTDTPQHSAATSVMLHVVPGIPVLAGVFLFPQSGVVARCGVDQQHAPLFGYLMSLLVCLVPLQLGILVFAGYKQTGRPTLRAAIRYTHRSSSRMYIILLPVLLIYNLLLFVVVAPRIQPLIVNALFSWYPEDYNFQLLMQAVMEDPAMYARLRGDSVLVVAYLILSGVVGPFVEELYFRGYLLPRMNRYSNRCAPLLNTVLFSVYHLFSPWENLVRIVELRALQHIAQLDNSRPVGSVAAAL